MPTPHLVRRNSKKKFISRFFKVLFLQVDKLETVILMHFYFAVSLYFVILFYIFQIFAYKEKILVILKKSLFSGCETQHIASCETLVL